MDLTCFETVPAEEERASSGRVSTISKRQRRTERDIRRLTDNGWEIDKSGRIRIYSCKAHDYRETSLRAALWYMQSVTSPDDAFRVLLSEL